MPLEKRHEPGIGKPPNSELPKGPNRLKLNPKQGKAPVAHISRLHKTSHPHQQGHLGEAASMSVVTRGGMAHTFRHILAALREGDKRVRLLNSWEGFLNRDYCPGRLS